MNKLFTKVASICLGLAMAVGVGVAVASSRDVVPVQAAQGDLIATGDFQSSDSTHTNWSTSHGDYYGNNNGFKMKAVNNSITSPSIASSNLKKVKVGIKAGHNNGSGSVLTVYACDSNGTALTQGTAVSGTVTPSQAYTTAVGNITEQYVELDTKDTIAKVMIVMTTKVNNCGVKLVNVYDNTPAATKALSSISLSGTYQTSFHQGDTFNHDGQIVTATYDDSTTANVTSDSTWSGYEMSSSGNQTVTVSYTEGNTTKTDTYQISVAELTNFRLTSSTPTKTAYTDGEEIDVSGLVAYASWDSVEDTSTNLANRIEWANGGVLSEGQTSISGYFDADNGHSFEVTASGFTVSEPAYTNTYNLKGQYVISHTKATGDHAGTTYYLKSNGDSAAPSPVTNIEDATVFSVKLVEADTFTFKAGNDYLYALNANDGIRIGTGDNLDKEWKITAGTKSSGNYNLQTTTNNRRIALYNVQDFRCYANADTNRTENTDLTPIKSVKAFDVVAGVGAQTRFLKGNPFNYSTAGYTAQITYDDDTTEDVSSYATWTLDTSTTGTNKTLTVTYTKKGVEYSDIVTGLEVYVVIAAKLSIDSSGATTTFVKDATLVTTGLVINGLNSNNDVVIENIDPSRCTFSPTTLSTVGSQTITVTYTNDDESTANGTYTVTVENNSVTAFSWQKRPGFNSEQSNYSNIWAGETTLGDLITANGEDGAGVFAPTWKYAKEDTPIFGTAEHQVHIGLYDVASPTVEGEALASSHVFTLAENNKYVVAFYEGKASSNNKQLSVVKWRSVIGDATISELFDYSSGGTTPTKSGDISSATIATENYTSSSSEGGIRLGSGSNTGKLTVTSSTYLITRIEASVKVYGSDGSSIKIGDDTTNVTESLTSSYVTYGVDFTTPVSSAYVTTIANSKRAYVESVTIYSTQKNSQIGKTSDCLGLESFIDTYLHMSDYTASEGWCKDEEHNYYGKNTETGAKYHFNQLNAHQRSLLSSNSAYAAEWARLSAWAAANGESLNSSSILAAARISPLANIVGNTNTIAVIVVISMISITCIGGYFFLGKRKEN